MARFVVLLAATMVATLLVIADGSVQAQGGPTVVINEIVAANDTFVDDFGGTPDWIELQNNGAQAVELAGWTIADDGGPWTLPAIALQPGARLVLFASGRNLPGPPPHTDFALKRGGETVTLADATGTLVDTVTYPELDDDLAYGRDPSGALGILLDPTPGAPNTALAPSSVTITTPPQTFRGTLVVEMSATTGPGEQVRYTTNSQPVTATSAIFDGSLTLSESTVVRAAVVGNGEVGPESSAGYIALSASILDFTSDLPIVLVHSTGAVGTVDQDAIVTVIEPGADGRAGVFDPGDYTGFAGLRIRGESSSQFPKKQYKFELWGDRLGDEVDADLLGMGADSDWGLYAPGYFDRAMISNPFVYELGKRLGVAAPDYRFVELFVEDDQTRTVGYGDYQGLYVLRETIKIDDERIDIAEHTPTSAGPDGGYILRYDWNDSCCRNIGRTRFGSYIAVDSPGRNDLTDAQFDYASQWWSELELAAETSFEAADAIIDFDSFIDHWLLEILAMDVDLLRASHYFHLDAGGQLQGGPLWDYDRGLGGRDDRNNDISEARAWEPGPPGGGHSYLSDVYEDLWEMPQVQARLRLRWAQLRSPGAVLSDDELTALIDSLGAEIDEAYVREQAEWGSVDGYGPRFGGGLSGELDHTRQWLLARTDWLDDQFASAGSPPVISVPPGVEYETNVAFGYQVQATGDAPLLYTATGLPKGLDIDPDTGLISGTVGFGDSYVPATATLGVATGTGATATAEVVLSDPGTSAHGRALVLNEFNAVAPGGFLDGGSDTTLGTVSGNGGDWFEIVTIQDDLDLRGWRFDLWSNDDFGDLVQTASLVLGDDPRFSRIRAGSLITVAESQPQDLSYDPANGDWTLALRANNARDGDGWSNQSGFDTNHKKWRLVVRDDTGAIAAYVGGETEAFAGPQDRNLNSSQVLALDVDPSADATTYRATVRSSFGQANPLPGGGLQDLQALRPELTVLGDALCDEVIDVTDALAIAQFSVGLRTDGGGCPLQDPATELNAAAADVDGDDLITVVDALIVAQCTVGLTNVLCP